MVVEYVHVLGQAQICAAGALLNIMGPDLERASDGPARCHALAQVFATAIASAAIQHLLLKSTPAIQ